MKPAHSAAPATHWRVSQSGCKEIKADITPLCTPLGRGAEGSGRQLEAAKPFQSTRGVKAAGWGAATSPVAPGTGRRAPGVLQLVQETKWTTGRGEPPIHPSPAPRGSPSPSFHPHHGGTAGRPAAALRRGPGKLRVVLFLPGGSELQQHKVSEGKKCTPGCTPQHPADPLTCVGTAWARRPAPSIVPGRPSPSPETRTIGRARSEAELAVARPWLALLLLRLHGGVGGSPGFGASWRAGPSPARLCTEVQRTLPAPGI